MGQVGFRLPSISVCTLVVGVPAHQKNLFSPAEVAPVLCLIHSLQMLVNRVNPETEEQVRTLEEPYKEALYSIPTPAALSAGPNSQWGILSVSIRYPLAGVTSWPSLLSRVVLSRGGGLLVLSTCRRPGELPRPPLCPDSSSHLAFQRVAVPVSVA